MQRKWYLRLVTSEGHRVSFERPTHRPDFFLLPHAQWP
jgi:hypothetical protein